MNGAQYSVPVVTVSPRHFVLDESAKRRSRILLVALLVSTPVAMIVITLVMFTGGKFIKDYIDFCGDGLNSLSLKVTLERRTRL